MYQATYEALKQRETGSIVYIEELKTKKVQEFSKLGEFIEKYPDLFRVLPNDLSTVKSNRLDILKEDIAVSSLEDSEKETIINVINGIDREIVETDKVIKRHEDALAKTREEIENREKYIIETEERRSEYVRQIKEIDEKVKIHESIANNETLDPSVRETAKSVIEKALESRKLLTAEIVNIFREPNYREDLEYFNKIKNQQEPQNEETPEREEATPEEEPTPEREGETPEEVPAQEREGETPEVEPAQEREEETAVVEPVVPEEPRRVKSVHKASPELIAKLKQAGKTTLGVLAIGAAVAAIIANPLALAALPAGGLLWEQAKEHLKKK